MAGTTPRRPAECPRAHGDSESHALPCPPERLPGSEGVLARLQSLVPETADGARAGDPPSKAKFSSRHTGCVLPCVSLCVTQLATFDVSAILYLFKTFAGLSAATKREGGVKQ